jgi:UDP-3-O-[3-hydroxymyristoyl] glucosamine N-acyltransferase
MIGVEVRNCGHLTGNNVRIQAQSGVGRNVKDDEVLQGSPTFAYNDYSANHYKIYRKSLQN